MHEVVEIVGSEQEQQGEQGAAETADHTGSHHLMTLGHDPLEDERWGRGRPVRSGTPTGDVYSPDLGHSSDMDSKSSDPDPRNTPGLRPEGTVPPGETPPAEGSTGSETGPRGDLSRGWATGPMIAIGLIVAVFAAFFLAYAVIIML